jgi:hypothetical protein
MRAPLQLPATEQAYVEVVKKAAGQLAAAAGGGGAATTPLDLVQEFKCVCPDFCVRSHNAMFLAWMELA